MCKHKANKKPSHRRGDGKRANRTEFAGLPITVVERLNKTLERNPHRPLSNQERKALELYWEMRLCTMKESMERGRNGRLLRYLAEPLLDLYRTER